MLLSGTMVLEYPQEHRIRRKHINTEARRTRRARARLRDRICHKMSVDTLLVCLCFGLAGILPDVDHLFPGYARAGHLPLAILCGIILCGAVALDYRHVHKSGIEASNA